MKLLSFEENILAGNHVLFAFKLYASSIFKKMKKTKLGYTWIMLPYLCYIRGDYPPKPLY